MRSVFSFCVVLTLCGALGAQLAEWEVNKPAASQNINGVLATTTAAAIVSQAIVNCPPPATSLPASGTITVSSTGVGLPWDIASNTLPLISRTQGAFDIGDGQVVNLNLGGGLTFVNGFLGQNFPVSFPGVTTSTITISYTLAAATNFSIQDVHIAPSFPLGIALSQATQYQAVVNAGSLSVPGPTSDDSSVSINVTAAPTCWCPGGLIFYGTTYTSIHVSSNGRVLFVGADTDFSASVAEALTDNPFVGYWTDFNPLTGGNITITNPAANLVSVNYNGIAYFTEPGTASTYSIVFDCATGIVSIENLTGIQTNPLTTASASDGMFLGMSPGNALVATDPGPTTFTLSGPNPAASSTAMIYDFNQGNTTLQGLPNSLTSGTLNRLIFIPDASVVPNYSWSGL